MKSFYDCPFCKTKLEKVNIFEGAAQILRCPIAQHCYVRLTDDNKCVFSLSLDFVKNNFSFLWASPEANIKDSSTCFISLRCDNKIKTCHMPFPEPDLSDIDKLLNKIQTLITFS